MNRKTRIVCTPTSIDYVSPNSGATYKIEVWQEVYSSPYRVDCIKWIESQKTRDNAIGNRRVYHIFVSEE